MSRGKKKVKPEPEAMVPAMAYTGGDVTEFDYKNPGAQDYIPAEIPDPEPLAPDRQVSELGAAVAEQIAFMRRHNEASKDLQLWAKDAASGRPRSEKILDPIKRALQKQGWLQVHATTGEGPLSDESMTKLFRDGLEPLERALGRLVLARLWPFSGGVSE